VYNRGNSLEEVVMLKPKSAQESFYGSYLYDKIVPPDHLIQTFKILD